MSEVCVFCKDLTLFYEKARCLASIFHAKQVRLSGERAMVFGHDCVQGPKVFMA